MTRTFRFAALAAAPLMLAAAPTAAKDTPAAPVLLTAIAAAQGDAAAGAGKEQRFCTTFDQPHSVLDRRICRTKARWAARGHDTSAL